MYFLTILTTIVDLAMMAMFVQVSQWIDRSHPLAVLIGGSIGPYFLHLYPAIINSAVFGWDVNNAKDVKETMKVYETIYNRDVTFKSIMLGTYTFMVVFAGFLMSTALVRCAKNDQKIGSREATMRTFLPCVVGMFFCMTVYNHVADVLSPKFANYPFIVLIIAHILFIGSLIWGMLTIKNIKEPNQNQIEMISSFNSLYIFGFVTAVPLGFMEFQIVNYPTYRFMFSDYETYIRLIFFASLILLEPFGSKFGFRGRFYRTAHEAPVSPAPVSAVSAAAAPLPNKTSLVDMPPVTDAPPAYETAKNLPTSWTVSPPSKEYTGVQMTPVEAQ